MDLRNVCLAGASVKQAVVPMWSGGEEEGWKPVSLHPMLSVGATGEEGGGGRSAQVQNLRELECGLTGHREARHVAQPCSLLFLTF